MIPETNKSREQLLQVLIEDIHARLSISECLLFGSTLRKFYNQTITESELYEQASSIFASHPDLLLRFPIFTANETGENFIDNHSNYHSKIENEHNYITGNLECLHDLLSSFDPGVAHVRKLLKLKPDSIKALDTSGKLPLHTACIRGVSFEVIQVLIDTYPIAISARDDMGRLPLHYYVDFANSGYSATSMTIEFLNLCMKKKLAALSAHAVTLLGANDFLMEKDDEGFTPFKTYAYECYLIEQNDEESDAKAKQIIDAFLVKCRPVSGEFLDTIRAFPHLFVKYIANNVHVRERLNREASSVSYFCTISLDLVFRFIICILFLIANHNAINKTMNGRTTMGYDQNELIILYILYLGSMYLFLRVGTRLMSFLEVNDMEHWYSDGFHWIQLIESGLVFPSIILIHLNPGKYQMAKAVATLASGLQWISILIILKSANLHFYMFLKGVINVVKKSVPFVLSSTVILFAFASMLFVYSFDMDKCFQETDEYLPCSFAKAVDITMNNFANSQINEDSFRHTPEFTMLTVTFSLVVLILQLNILIAVVTDSYASVKEEGIQWFWLDRLFYTSESYCLQKMFGCIKYFPVPDNFGERLQTSMSKRWTAWYDRCWREKRRKREARQKLRLKKEITLIQGMFSYLERSVLALLLSLWIIFGFITLGYFLPRQVREYFVFEEVDKKENNKETVMSREEMLVMVSEEIKMQMRVSSTAVRKKLDLTSEKLDVILDSLPALLMNNATE